jgi:hypothetical protein
MGAGSSLPSRDTLTSETIKTKNILNGILEFMLSESDLLDMYALASPTECRQYTLFTTKTIDNFFKKIQLYPRKGEDGRFYFQKLQTIQRLPGEFATKQRQTCLEISRFFIRILHIFASLSLTVIDMEVPRSNNSLNVITQAKNKNGRRVLRENEVLSLPFMRQVQRGGALYPTQKQYYITNPNYQMLNDYLTLYSGTSEYVLAGTDIHIPIRSVNPVTPEPFLTFSGKNKDGETIKIEANLRIIQNDDKLDVSLDILKPKDIGSIGPVRFTRSTRYAEPSYNNQILPKYVMKVFNQILGKSEYNLNTNIKRNITRRRTKASLPDDIEPSFQVKNVLSALSKDVPVKAYCVARAVQLLSPDSLYYSTKDIRTQICDPNFSLLGKGSLPGSEELLTTSPAIMSLYLLFFDALEVTTPTISAQTRPMYDEFVKTMTAVYEEESATTNKKTNMKKIKNNMNPTLCKTKGRMYVSDEAAANNLRSAATTLLSKQLQHTAKVMNILKKLFIITPSRPILLQPAIEAGGMDAVEKIAAEARDLLIDYYSSCEVTYRDAVQDLKERVDKNPNILKIDPRRTP